jgi:hypothetical protein
MIVDLSEPKDPRERQALNLPPLVGDPSDLATALRNWLEGARLCARCNGTGNELWSMYRSCEDCGGSGVSQDEAEAPTLETDREELSR